MSPPESAIDLLRDNICNALVVENVGLDSWQLANIFAKSQILPAYSNYFNPAEGSILCWYNDKRDDTNAPENQLQWSEAIFEVYQMLATRRQQSVKNIRTIWRHWIVNEDTNAIITEARRGDGQEVEHAGYTEFRAGTSGFYALLGSPNGSGIVRMLTEHAQAFGRKTIEGVRVLNPQISSPPTLYFVLSQAEILPVTPRVSKSRARRLLSRSVEVGRKRRRRNPSGDEPPGSLSV